MHFILANKSIRIELIFKIYIINLKKSVALKKKFCSLLHYFPLELCFRSYCPFYRLMVSVCPKEPTHSIMIGVRVIRSGNNRHVSISEYKHEFLTILLLKTTKKLFYLFQLKKITTTKWILQLLIRY